MGNKIITIAREYGCGGRLIAKKLADRLGFDYYDSDLISLAAEKTGMTEAYIKEIEQKKVSNFLYTLFLSGQSLTLADQVFIAQAEIIRAAAEKNSSVFSPFLQLYQWWKSLIPVNAIAIPYLLQQFMTVSSLIEPPGSAI